MKRFCVLLAFLLVGPQLFSAQETAVSGMPTIETDFFTRLEKRLMDVVVAQNRSALEPLLANDFELRTARSGGELTLRDEWLQAATTAYKVRSYQISHLTVRQMGTIAVVNFFYGQQASYVGADISGDFFLVDIWEKGRNDWKLVARYSAGPGVIPKSAPNRKTKE